MEELTTPVVVMGGVLASLFTAATAAYSSYRSAKYEADAREDQLLKKELERANSRIDDLSQQCEYWRSRAVAAEAGGPR